MRLDCTRRYSVSLYYSTHLDSGRRETAIYVRVECSWNLDGARYIDPHAFM
jgi:hypothetical protein